MAQKDILGIAGMTRQELSFELNRGGRFVIYRFCVSVVIVTIWESSNVYFLRAGESRISKGVRWSMLSLVMGWWGIPWGPIRTIHSLWVNFHGGEDVTGEVASMLEIPDVNWDAIAAGQS
jgi:hypothetical protein